MNIIIMILKIYACITSVLFTSLLIWALFAWKVINQIDKEESIEEPPRM